MKRALGAALLFVALAAAAVFASSTTTEQPTVYMILMPDDSIEKGKVWPKTEDECVARAKALTPAGSCSIRRKFVTTTTCADEKAPKLYLSKVKNPEDGKDYWELPGASWTDDTFIEMAELYVHNATWPAGFPNCWVPGRAPRDEWRLNSKDEPGKAFMEIRTPDMPPGDLVAEETSEMEPTWHTPEQKAALDAFNTEWQAREDASAAACAAGDATQCPPQPVLVGACGDYRSPACGPG